MFSDAISSISWRWRPSSPWIAAAISGSASARVAVKNESGAEAVLMLEADGLIGEISPPPQPVRGLRPVTCGDRKRRSRDTISGGNGQALAVGARYLCKIWWGWAEFQPAPRRPGPDPGPIIRGGW